MTPLISTDLGYAQLPSVVTSEGSNNIAAVVRKEASEETNTSRNIKLLQNRSQRGKILCHPITHRILAIATGSSAALVLLKGILKVSHNGFMLYVPW